MYITYPVFFSVFWTKELYYLWKQFSQNTNNMCIRQLAEVLLCVTYMHIS